MILMALDLSEKKYWKKTEIVPESARFGLSKNALFDLQT